MSLRPLAGVVWIGGVMALSGAAAAPDPSWTVDRAKSTLGFTASQSGAPFTGQFKTWTAAITFDPAHPETAHVLASVDIASAATGDAQKDEAMPGEDWFDAARFTTATFEAKSFVPQGGDAYLAHGTLSLRGIAKNLDLPFTLNVDGGTARAVGHAKLVRTDFGVGQGPWASGDTVALDVTVDLDLVATKAP